MPYLPSYFSVLDRGESLSSNPIHVLDWIRSKQVFSQIAPTTSTKMLPRTIATTRLISRNYLLQLELYDGCLGLLMPEEYLMGNHSRANGDQKSKQSKFSAIVEYFVSLFFYRRRINRLNITNY